LSSEDGLSSLSVNCIMQDSRGFMWMGTQDGLNKYDGYQIRVYKNDPTNSNSLNSSEITCLTQIREDLIIIGTREGVNYFNPVTETFTSLSNIKALKSRINSIVKADDKNVWIGCEEGLFLLNIEQKTIRNYAFVIKEKTNVRSIAVVRGIVYVGTEGKGLWTIDHGEVKKVDFSDEELITVDPKELETITEIRSYAGKLYLGTYGFGIFKMDETGELEQKILMVDAKIPDGGNFIKAIEIRDSKMYVATSYGFFIYNLLSQKMQSVIHKNEKFGAHGLAGEKIESLFIDKIRNIWLGFSIEGVNISFFQAQKFPQSNAGTEIEFGNVYAFCETPRQEKLIGGMKTLYLLDKNNNVLKNFSSKLTDNAAISIYQQDEKYFWIGTWGGGLFRLNSESGEMLSVISSKEGGTILCLKGDGNGSLYAGTVGDGYFKVNLKTTEFKKFKDQPALTDYNINTFYKDKQNNVWIGTYDGGLIKTKGFPDDGKFEITQIYKNDGQNGHIASNIVLDVNEDLKGNLWVATGAGVSRLVSNGTFRSYYEKDGLSNSYLYCLLRDSLGNFWMTSNKGLIKFNPLLPEQQVLFRNFDLKDGLINSEYNIGAYLAAPSGMIYVGGANGFNSFRASGIKDNFNVPNVYVVGYKRGGTDVVTDSSIVYKKELNLNWSENYFQLEVVALDYTDPSKNKFRYKLEGYDKDWSAPSTVRYISYTELPGNDYVFKVKAANNDGVWNETPCEIKITVVPPFWKTKLFYILMIVVAIGGVYGFTQYRTDHMKKENKLLEIKVTERTRELAEKNRDITSSIEYAKRIQEAILPSRENIFAKLQKVFILYMPKDIVSGDFYWFGEKNGKKIFAVVDCTGHGVPGAFMSMIGHNLMNQIIQEKGITEPGEILNSLHKGVQDALRQGQNEISTNDGMDISILTIGSNGETHWAGANRPIILINEKGEFQKFDGNKYPVGGAQIDVHRTYTQHVIKANGPSMAYMSTDGFADQFGGEKGKKFMVRRFHDVLLTIHNEKPESQRATLLYEFEAWRKDHEQVDDVLVVGIAI
jgi:ligand-binding sensor domain-containing protein/serine phosphatase RsbU (regulator of sigma subunit)